MQLEYIYIAKANNNHKIGYTKSLTRRLRQMKTANHSIEIIHTIPVLNGRVVEKKLHAYFFDKRISGEWYDLNENEVSLVLECKTEYDILEMCGFH